jgi:hypothetical protein
MLDLLQLSKQQRATLQTAAEAYHQQATPRAVSYLEARGLDRDAASGHLLGEVCDPLPGHERFTGMLSIPYLSRAGVLGFKFRCMGDHDCKPLKHPKYDSPSGQRARLFNVNALLDRGDTIAIVEGEMSALIVQTVTGVPTVGTPGTQWAKEHPHWPRCFTDFDRIFVIADHDVTDDGKTDQGRGVGHAKRVANSLPGAELILPPPGMDPDEWVQCDGPADLMAAMGLE